MRRLGVALLCITCMLAIGSSAWSAQIHDAAAKGDLAKVKSLIEQKPQLLNLVDKDGATPLHYAVAKNRISVVLWLIDRKANVNAKKKDGVTPLHVAASLGYKEIVDALLAAKADKGVVDKKGRTPLSLAQSGNHQAVANLLLSATASAVPSSLPVPNLKPSAPQPSEPEKMTRELVADLTTGNYATVVSHFDQTMKTALPEPKLRETYTAVTSQYGAFSKLINVQCAKVQGMDVVCATCEFEKAKIDVQVTYNAAKEVAGLFMTRSQAR